MSIDPKILAFDVFGTVVDWHGSIAAEATRLNLPVEISPNLPVIRSHWMKVRGLFL